MVSSFPSLLLLPNNQKHPYNLRSDVNVSLICKPLFYGFAMEKALWFQRIKCKTVIKYMHLHHCCIKDSASGVLQH